MVSIKFFTKKNVILYLTHDRCYYSKNYWDVISDLFLTVLSPKSLKNHWSSACLFLYMIKYHEADDYCYQEQLQMLDKVQNYVWRNLKVFQEISWSR